MEQFITKLVEIMDVAVNSISYKSVLAEIEDWDSIAVISFIALAKKDYNIVLKATDIKKAVTVADLFMLLS